VVPPSALSEIADDGPAVRAPAPELAGWWRSPKSILLRVRKNARWDSRILLHALSRAAMVSCRNIRYCRIEHALGNADTRTVRMVSDQNDILTRLSLIAEAPYLTPLRSRAHFRRRHTSIFDWYPWWPGSCSCRSPREQYRDPLTKKNEAMPPMFRPGLWPPAWGSGSQLLWDRSQDSRFQSGGAYWGSEDRRRIRASGEAAARGRHEPVPADRRLWVFV
jgi:hypothetical protein